MSAETVTAEDETPVASEAIRLFRYSSWVHVGPGAEGCEAIDEEEPRNECSNPLHFHAWCRLPNQFQHRDLREKALAAKARKTRQLRDPLSDAFAVLEEDMDRLAAGGDAAKADLIEELVRKDWWRDYVEAAADVVEIEEEGEDPGKLYGHIQDDQARYLELDAMPEAERPADEYESLQRHITAYNDAVDAAVKKRADPRRVALEALDINAIVDRVRGDRIEATAMDEFMHTYSTHEWFVCTLKLPGGEQRFASLEAMQASAPEVIGALKEAYSDLERTANGGGEGNS